MSNAYEKIKNTRKDFWRQIRNVGKRIFKNAVKWDEVASELQNRSAIDSRDIKLAYFYDLVKADPSQENM